MAAPTTTGTLQLGGQERPFTLGPAHEAALRALLHRRGDDGEPMSRQAYADLLAAAKLDLTTTAPADARDFVYAALAAGYQQARARIDFNHMSVGAWLEEAPEAVAHLAALLNPAPAVKLRPAKKSHPVGG